MKHPLIVIVVNSIILAAGVMVVLVACLQYHSYYPLLTILINVLSITQLMLCGACGSQDAFGEDYASMGMDGTEEVLMAAGLHTSWLLFGTLVIMGYAIPSLLYRAGDVGEVALYLTWAGGSTILAAMIIYMKLLYGRDQDTIIQF